MNNKMIMDNKEILTLAIKEYKYYKELISYYKDFNSFLMVYDNEVSDAIVDRIGEYVDFYLEACKLTVYNIGGRPVVNNTFTVWDTEPVFFVNLYEDITLAEAEGILEGMR